MTATARPVTCSAIAAIDPALGQAGCKRLPRHKGDHRTTLHIARAAKPKASVKAPKGRVSREDLKALSLKLAASGECVSWADVYDLLNT